MSATRTSAPLGIKIICLLATIGAMLGAVGGIALVALGGIGVVLGPLVVVLALAQLAAVYGLWTLQSWGWTLAMGLYGLDATLDLIGIAVGDFGSVVGLAVAVVILGYVYSKRDHYRSSERTVPPANRI